MDDRRAGSARWARQTDSAAIVSLELCALAVAVAWSVLLHLAELFDFDDEPAKIALRHGGTAVCLTVLSLLLVRVGGLVLRMRHTLVAPRWVLGPCLVAVAALSLATLAAELVYVRASDPAVWMGAAGVVCRCAPLAAIALGILRCWLLGERARHIRRMRGLPEARARTRAECYDRRAWGRRKRSTRHRRHHRPIARSSTSACSS